MGSIRRTFYIFMPTYLTLHLNVNMLINKIATVFLTEDPVFKADLGMTQG